MFRKVELPYKHDIGPFEDVLKNKKSTFQKKHIGGGVKTEIPIWSKNVQNRVTIQMLTDAREMLVNTRKLQERQE